MLIFRKTLRTYLTDDLLCNDWLILQWFNYCGKQTFALMLINHRYLKHCMQFVWIILVDYSSSFQGFCQRFLFTFLVSIRFQVINTYSSLLALLWVIPKNTRVYCIWRIQCYSIFLSTCQIFSYHSIIEII